METAMREQDFLISHLHERLHAQQTALTLYTAQLTSQVHPCPHICNLQPAAHKLFCSLYSTHALALHKIVPAVFHIPGWLCASSPLLQAHHECRSTSCDLSEGHMRYSCEFTS